MITSRLDEVKSNYYRILTCLAILSLSVMLRVVVFSSFTYAGTDSYSYLGAAGELAEHHRYAIPLAPWLPGQLPPGVQTSLSYERLPGYSLFLAPLMKAPVREYKDYLPVFVRIKPVQAALDLLVCAMIFVIARWMRGPAAAWPAFLLAALNPFFVLFEASVLSEILATFCSTLALFCLLAALYRTDRSRLFWPLGGSAIALGMLVRSDSILLVPCLFLPVFLPKAVGLVSRRAGLGLTAAALLALTVVFAPWPVRNWLQFGFPHPFGYLCDVRGRQIQHTAFFGWFATWLEKESEIPGTLYCFANPGCVSNINNYPQRAFDSAAERMRVAQLFQLRAQEGLSDRVDQEFGTLTLERIRRHPIRSLLGMPLMRAYYLWTGVPNQPLRDSPMSHRYSAVFGPLSIVSRATMLLGLVGLAMLWMRHRAAAFLLTIASMARTSFLSFFGFVEIRYLFELLPIVIALGGLPIAALWTRWMGTLRAIPCRDHDSSPLNRT